MSHPARVVSARGDRATVELDGARLEVDTRPVGLVRPGDFLLVHAGLAIERIDAAVAGELAELLALINEEEHA